MLIKGITDEDFINYKKPSMVIITNQCTFKCDIENGVQCCQNCELVKAPSLDINNEIIIKRYLSNNITKAMVFAGLEPFDQYLDVFEIIYLLRCVYDCSDDVVIYTGYNKNEIEGKIKALKPFKNIIVKYGRFVPDQESKYDDVLGVYLASPNQYAEQIS